MGRGRAKSSRKTPIMSLKNRFQRKTSNFMSLEIMTARCQPCPTDTPGAINNPSCAPAWEWLGAW